MGECEAAPCALQAWGSERRLGLDTSKDAANNNPPDAAVTSGDETSLGRAQRQRKGASCGLAGTVGTPCPDSGFHPPTHTAPRGPPSAPSALTWGFSLPGPAPQPRVDHGNPRASCPAQGVLPRPRLRPASPGAPVLRPRLPPPPLLDRGPERWPRPPQGLSALTSAHRGPGECPCPSPGGSAL